MPVHPTRAARADAWHMQEWQKAEKSALRLRGRREWLPGNWTLARCLRT